MSLSGTDDSYMCCEHSRVDKPVKSLSYTPEPDTTVCQLYFFKKVSFNKEKRVFAAELFELTTTGKTNHYKTPQRPPKEMRRLTKLR